MSTMRHEIAIVTSKVFWPGEYSANCLCGYSSRWKFDKEEAITDGNTHIEHKTGRS
jgi:hypothetical protein